MYCSGTEVGKVPIPESLRLCMSLGPRATAALYPEPECITSDI